MSDSKKTKKAAKKQPTLPAEGMARPQHEDVNEAIEAFDKTGSKLSELRARANEQRIVLEERMRSHNLTDYLWEEGGLRVVMTTKEKAKIMRPGAGDDGDE